MSHRALIRRRRRRRDQRERHPKGAPQGTASYGIRFAAPFGRPVLRHSSIRRIAARLLLKIASFGPRLRDSDSRYPILTAGARFCPILTGFNLRNMLHEMRLRFRMCHKAKFSAKRRAGGSGVRRCGHGMSDIFTIQQRASESRDDTLVHQQQRKENLQRWFV